jgi:hypothetical protein
MFFLMSGPHRCHAEVMARDEGGIPDRLTESSNYNSHGVSSYPSPNWQVAARTFWDDDKMIESFYFAGL